MSLGGTVLGTASLTRHGFSSRVISPQGSCSNGVYIIGEAPGEQENTHGVPFYERAPAGAILARALRRAGLVREDFRIANVVWQQPPRNWLDGAPWEEEAIEAWRATLEADIVESKAKVIVALGNTALKAVTSFGRGQRRTISFVRGYPIPAKAHKDIWVVPSYHPSFLLPRKDKKNASAGGLRLLGTLIYDLKRAVEIARNGLIVSVVNAPNFLMDPSSTLFKGYLAGYDPSRHVLSYDIETPKSSHLDEEDVEKKDESYKVVRISLCYGDDEAASVPWQEPYISMVREVLASSGPKRVWNGNFDNPRLKADGVTINGRIYDMMWGWHYLQPSLPRALEFVTPFYNWTLGPWKFEGEENPAYYSCCDALALHMCGEGIMSDLKSINAVERFESHVVDVYDVLTKMSTNGLPYSKEKAAEFREKLKVMYEERFEKVQSLVPDELKPVQPKHGYKRVPKEVEYALALYKDCAYYNIPPPCATEAEYLYKRTGMRLITVEDIDKETLELIKVSRWAKVLPFLPTSHVQVKAYCKWKKYKLLKDYKTKKETTDEDALRKLKVRHPKDEVLPLVIECRQLKKVLGTYVDGWKPGEDGRIHATPGFWGAMFRISWRKPNISATVADKKDDYIAAGFRKCVEAPKGYVLLERDWSGMEAVLVGWFAGDANYMRLGRLGIHAYMTSVVLAGQGKINQEADLTWSDSDLREFFSDLKKEFRHAYDQSKHGVHLSNYMGTPALMTDMFPESFPTRTAAKKWQDFYFSTVAKKVRKWQVSTMDKAHKESRLVNPYGYPMWFWDVYQWDSRSGKYRLGNDAKSAVSFLPRDTAAGMLKDVLLRLEEFHHLASDGVMLAPTHDSVLCQVREDDVGRVDLILKTEMERPVPELDGLSIRTEGKVGKCWDEESMRSL